MSGVVMRELTDRERAAIRDLRRVMARWPDTLGFFTDGGALTVIRLTAPGAAYIAGPDQCKGVDQSSAVDSFNVFAEGGEWS